MRALTVVMATVLTSGVLVGTAQARTPEQPDTVEMVAMGTLGGQTAPTAVNRAGTEIVGYSTAGYVDHAVKWDTEGRMTVLDSRSSSAVAVNDAGTVLGRREDPVAGRQTVLWDRRGRVSVLTTESQEFTSGVAMNDNGEVAAIGWPPDPRWPYGVRWDRHGRSTVLVPPPGYTSFYTLSINSAGTILGQVGTPSGFGHAALWYRDGRFVDLGTLPGYDATLPTDLNDKGEVVGYSWSLAGSVNAVKWDAAGHIARLDGRDSGAYAIDQRGTAVGIIRPFSTQRLAVKWDRRGVATDLSPLAGGSQSWPGAAPDADGTVIGTSTTSAGHQHAVAWNDTGRPTDLSTLPGDTDSAGTLITQQGLMVGISTSDLERSDHPVLWRPRREGRALDTDVG